MSIENKLYDELSEWIARRDGLQNFASFIAIRTYSMTEIIEKINEFKARIESRVNELKYERKELMCSNSYSMTDFISYCQKITKLEKILKEVDKK